MAEPDFTLISRQLEAVRDEQRRQGEQMRQLDIRLARIEDSLHHLDGLMSSILAELRAIRTQTAHFGERITALES